MKKTAAILLAVLMLVSLVGCKAAPKPVEIGLEQSQMRMICELAVMECYYHNVAKFTQEDATGFWLWKKDKHFWIEYSGTVKLGIDASRVAMKQDGDKVTITLPPAKVLTCEPDQDSINSDSYIIDHKSASINSADTVKAIEEAQKKLRQKVQNDQALLNEAQQRAKTLLEDYVNNIGRAVGKEYAIEWEYLEEDAPEEKSEPAAAAAGTAAE